MWKKGGTLSSVHSTVVDLTANLNHYERNARSTIYALSSGFGKCGVAVVRVSGPESLKILYSMAKIAKPEPRRVYLRKIYKPNTDEIIDKGLCLWFPGPRSFTGEDCVEFQVHGGPAILASLMESLSSLNLIPASAGEFTRRAFYNNKLDLTEVEGLADLIHAETEQQRKQALFQASGQLSKLYNGWRNNLLSCIAMLEAYVDFSEEDNLSSNILGNCEVIIKELIKDIEVHLVDSRKGEVLRNGVKTVILGEPNVGKSSFLNRLVQRQVAIVAPLAGTTRDIVETVVNISGYPLILADTAGISKKTKNVVEIEGIKRARAYAEYSDLILLVFDAHKCINSGKNYNDYLEHYVSQLEIDDLIFAKGRSFISLGNKIDLLCKEQKKLLESKGMIGMSCKTEDGLREVLEKLTIQLEEICGMPTQENPVISQRRYRDHLNHCLEYLHTYLKMSANDQYDIAIAVEQIRRAMQELGMITGHVSNEEILDVIFKNFCIGK
ncbi:hypothetical protein KM043_014322 [Ampulex compressa]|nr:hypothetical protein KM043_014322 [Ampulex compressa]